MERTEMTPYNLMYRATQTIAKASDGSPLIAVSTVMLFYLMVNVFEGILEKLIYGHAFNHWGDVPISIFFIAWAGYAVYHCAIYNTQGLKKC